MGEAAARDRPGLLPGDYVVLSVEDSGRGMDDETRRNLFEPFFTTKDVGEGTGLGLATVYGIVKQAGGFIDVSSGIGSGTTFQVMFPRHGGTVSSRRVNEPTEVPRGRGETVLVVEDESSILRLTQTVLSELGYRVIAAQTPEEARAVAADQTRSIDLLLTDIVMAGTNGRDLARQLAEGRKDLRAVFMSGYTDDVIADHGVLEEGVHFLQKPFSHSELAVRVREALDD